MADMLEPVLDHMPVKKLCCAWDYSERSQFHPTYEGLDAGAGGCQKFNQ